LWIDCTKDGKATIRGSLGSDSGTSWIEGDMVCAQWQLFMEGIKGCAHVFRNPDGTPEMKNEYLRVTDFGILPFSPVN